MLYDEDRPFADIFHRARGRAAPAAEPPSPSMAEMRFHTVAIPLHGGRTLHVALTRNAAGVAEDIVIGCGYVSEDRLRVLGRGVNVPASSLPALRDALEQLDEERAK